MNDLKLGGMMDEDWKRALEQRTSTAKPPFPTFRRKCAEASAGVRIELKWRAWGSIVGFIVGVIVGSAAPAAAVDKDIATQMARYCEMTWPTDLPKRTLCLQDQRAAHQEMVSYVPVPFDSDVMIKTMGTCMLMYSNLDAVDFRRTVVCYKFLMEEIGKQKR